MLMFLMPTGYKGALFVVVLRLNKVSIELCDHIMDFNQIPNNWNY